MRTNRYFLFACLALLPAFSSCMSLFEPEDDNHSSINRVYSDPNFAEGLLLYAYHCFPTVDYRWDETGTDDAVSNNPADNFRRIATGEWTSLFNPQTLWNECNRGIMNLNQFLEVVDNVPWSPTAPAVNEAFVRRLKGEAYALRGILKYYLIRNHGGKAADGTLLGIPEYNQFPTTPADFSRSRATFAESVASADKDFDQALALLPTDYGDVEVVPAAYSGLDVNGYNLVFGKDYRQRLSGRHVQGFKALLALLAASPAFNLDGDTTRWETAAQRNGEVLKGIGGIAGMDPKGNLFYLKEQIDDANLNTGNKQDIAEFLWRRAIGELNGWEIDNFPPSLYGHGRINPTQNFVDAFPMKNGYPITDAASGYDPAHPYQNRDPRLAQTVVTDGSKVKGRIISILTGNGEDVLNHTQYSTRTGYYLRKLLREDVNADPKATNVQYHIVGLLRYTEFFLNYAEAANEAWGPDGTGSFGFSAKDVIAAIRKRAGISQPDRYLESVSGKEQMRALIRNERRLELSFESFRFWDLRRWGTTLSEPARGIRYENNTYEIFEVEPREYEPYMQYGPLPSQEVLKFGLQQNEGWN